MGSLAMSGTLNDARVGVAMTAYFPMRESCRDGSQLCASSAPEAYIGQSSAMPDLVSRACAEIDKSKEEFRVENDGEAENGVCIRRSITTVSTKTDIY